MKKFIIESIIFLTSIVTLFIGYCVYIHLKASDSDTYLLAYNDKMERLETTVGQERIVLVGGSNLAFSIDSKQLSDSLGRTIVNTGLHAGLGLRTPMLDVGSRIKASDVIIFMPEYEHFFGDHFDGRVTLPELVLLRPEIIMGMNLKQYSLVFSNFKDAVTTLKKDYNHTETQNGLFRYSRNGFNEYGDEVSHLDYGSAGVNIKPIEEDFNIDIYNVVMQILDGWAEKGCKVIFLCPGVFDQQYHINKEKLDDLIAFLSENCPYFHNDLGIPTFTEDEVFDTMYHLNKDGVKKNTIRVIEQYRKIE